MTGMVLRWSLVQRAGSEQCATPPAIGVALARSDQPMGRPVLYPALSEGSLLKSGQIAGGGEGEDPLAFLGVGRNRPSTEEDEQGNGNSKYEEK